MTARSGAPLLRRSSTRLVGEARSGANAYRTTFVYDPAGNRTLEDKLVDGRLTSTYDGANRLLRATAFSGITTYSYDAAGNRRSVETPAGDVTTSTWNGENQLIRAELPTGEVVTYVWDPVNKRSEERIVTRDDGVTPLTYLWDNNNVLRETDDLGTVEAEYTYQPQPYGDLVSQRRASESHYYRYDALGSTTALTDGAGNVTDAYRYFAFGKEATSSGTTETPYRWLGRVGYRADEQTGLSYVRARHYDPATGRFISPDPLGLNAGDENFYRYVGNDPAGRSDPSGLDPDGEFHDDGRTVVIRNTSCDPSKVFVGDRVKQGNEVGRAGCTGRSVHLDRGASGHRHGSRELADSGRRTDPARLGVRLRRKPRGGRIERPQNAAFQALQTVVPAKPVVLGAVGRGEGVGSPGAITRPVVAVADVGERRAPQFPQALPHPAEAIERPMGVPLGGEVPPTA